MTQDKHTIRILELCLDIDRKAAAVYKQFACHASDEELRKFWQALVQEELSHVEYWLKLRDLARQGALPQIFDNPEKLEHELQAGMDKVSKYIDLVDPADVTGTFIAGGRFEFYMQHRVFGALLQLIESITGDRNVQDEYEAHIKKFIKGMNKYGKDHPELEILGETLDRLWADNRELAERSNMDPLTGVFNRRGLFQTIKPLAHLSRRNNYHIGVIMLDLDDFKQVNDTHGHSAGDDVLRIAARAISENLRRSDVLGRYGGEEFLVFLSHTEPDGIRVVGDKIRRSLEQAPGNEFGVTVSVGAHACRLGEDTDRALEAAIKIADENLYKAKKQGKNCVVSTSCKD